MSDLPDPRPEDTLAAEYVLGTLDAATAEAARLRAETDPVFAAEIRFWEARLAPLATLAPQAPPPEGLLTRIESSVFPRQRPNWWRATAVGSLAIAASLAAFILLRSPAPPDIAVLTAYGGQTPVLIALARPDGSLLVRPNAAVPHPPDHDLQLWALAAGATRPASLGLIQAGGRTVPPGLARGTTLLVSLEPKGGSPTGQPTGPVLYGGRLDRLD